jgi:hypothetical protein
MQSKTTRIALLALLLSGAFAGAGHAATSVTAGIQIGPSGRPTVDVGFFYDDLAPYGRWIERPQYGWVWTPRNVASSWQPYEDGHWVWTDEGWTWISDEPYGWATYHYGRWYDDPDYGWEWIPGDEWAPAWVSWQEGDDYVGWAPLPPSVAFRTGRLDVRLAPEAYVFVPVRQFLAPRIRSYVLPRTEVVRIYPRTRNITTYQVVNDRIVNQGIAVDRIQQVAGRRVTRYQIADLDGGQRHRGSRIAQDRLSMFRPQVKKVKVAPPSARAAARRSVATAPARGRRVEVRKEVHQKVEVREKTVVHQQKVQRQHPAPVRPRAQASQRRPQAQARAQHQPRPRQQQRAEAQPKGQAKAHGGPAPRQQGKPAHGNGGHGKQKGGGHGR